MAYDFELLPIIEHLTSEILPKTHGKFKICCVLHEEDRPSMSIDLNRNSWYCFVCMVGGDAIQLLREKEGLNFAEALERAEGITGQSGVSLPGGAAQPGRAAPPSLFGGGARAKRGNHRPVSTGGRTKPRGLR